MTIDHSRHITHQRFIQSLLMTIPLGMDDTGY
jgi:hypothetical protein